MVECWVFFQELFYEVIPDHIVKCTNFVFTAPSRPLSESPIEDVPAKPAGTKPEEEEIFEQYKKVEIEMALQAKKEVSVVESKCHFPSQSMHLLNA